jgi:hypothetical protein
MTKSGRPWSRWSDWLRDPRQIPVADLKGMERGLGVIVRNWYWARTHGWADLLEEHDLNPLVRVPREARKLAWRLTSSAEPGQAHPILLFGAQRSGTNMVTHGLANAPEMEVYNEGDRRAFDRYRVRPPGRLVQLTTRSRHEFVLFKPLNDSHRAAELLDQVDWNRPARGLWVYREVRGRARSAVAKFGDSNLRVLKKRSEMPGYRHWQLEGLSDESAAILDTFDPSSLSAVDGAALFWLIRNRIVFERGLHEREDVLLVSYDRFVAEPESQMTRICQFLSFPYEPSLISHVQAPTSTPNYSSDIAPRIRAMCDEFMGRLEGVAALS